VSRCSIFLVLSDGYFLSRRNPLRASACLVVASILCLAGCLQESPPVFKERTISILLELVRDGEVEVRRNAAESLGKIGDPRATESMLFLMHDSAPAVREASIIALGRLKPIASDGLLVLLTQALRDPVESVRQAAVVAMGEIEAKSSLLAPVIGLLRSPEVTTRRAAVQALLQVDSSQWVCDLVAAGLDSDAEVRQGVVAVVGEWGGVPFSPWLRERLVQDPSPRVRAEAAYRLGLLSDPDAKAALNNTITKDQDSGVRRWAKRGV